MEPQTCGWMESAEKRCGSTDVLFFRQVTAERRTYLCGYHGRKARRDGQAGVKAIPQKAAK